MREFKNGDLVKLKGDASNTIYTLFGVDSSLYVSIDHETYGSACFFKGTGIHMLGAMPDILHLDEMFSPPTPVPLANAQLSGGRILRANWTKQEYLAFVEKTFAEMHKLIKRKNSDYTGTIDDPFANFRRATQVGVDPIKGLAVRFLDKVARIESFLQAGKLENESFEDAWLDVIGYAALALGMIKERNQRMGIDV